MITRKALLTTTAIATAAGLAGTSIAFGTDGDHHAGAQRAMTYEVTVQNTTAGQPFSPPFLAVHSAVADFWSVGDIASHPVAAIAEDANNAPAIEVAGKIRGVKYAMTGVGKGASSPAPIGPGASQTYTVTSRGKHNRLTVLTMLVNTNDGFTGLDGLRLPERLGATMTYAKMAYDAGSEANNEMAKYIPGPVGNSRFARAPEGELIRMHPGIVGGADLDPTTHSVAGTVAKISITRVK